MIHLPRPKSSYWAGWLDGLSDAQLAAVGSWMRAGHYRRLLSPQVCWYQLCGRHDPAERKRRQSIEKGAPDSPQMRGANARWGRNGVSEAILGHDPQKCDKAAGAMPGILSRIG